MQTFNYNLTNKNPNDAINDEDYQYISKYKDILIQVFSGDSYKKTQELLLKLKIKFPNAHIITSSTDGEILQNLITTKNIVISITVFKETKLKTAYANNGNCFDDGVELAKRLLSSNTKLLILFLDGINTNGENFLNGVYSIAPNVMVAGGISGDNGNFTECFIGEDNNLNTKGAVGVALNSDTLIVENLYSLGWDKIGIEHTITKAEKNRVYEIDGLNAFKFYEKYLGKEASKELPSIGMEFPLILDRDTMHIARAMISKNDDGSLMFAGDIPTGSKVYLGLGDISKILTNHISNLSSENNGTFFIYSCMARRRFIPNDIYKEITQFSSLAPTAGFFTYGEFYKAEKLELLNQTLTAVSLFENSDKNPIKIPNIKEKRDSKYNNMTIKTLTNILNQTYLDLEEGHNELKKTNAELIASLNTFSLIQELTKLSSWQMDIKTKKITWLNNSQKIININPDADDLNYDEFINAIYPEDKKKFLSKLEALKDGNVHSIVIKLRDAYGKTIHILESAKYMYEDGVATKIIGTSLDITEFREQEQQLMQQSRLAQMGEMISMIAHQWRQPLNAITAASIKLELKREMEILDDSELKETMTFIQETTQRMSNTINDFMDLANNTNKVKEFSIKSIFHEVENIINPQLLSRNIKLQFIDKYDTLIKIQKNELIHIIINILINAKDAFSNKDYKEKNITIETLKYNNKCIIEITDNAGGIPNDIIYRIFEPYFTTKKHGKGTGLGLYMSKKILNEVLNGDLEVSNTSDGAKFKIILNNPGN